MNEAAHLDELLSCRLDTGKRTVDPCTIVIFGASGDLTYRKLIPALYHLYLEDQLPSPFRIIGYARREKTDESSATNDILHPPAFDRFRSDVDVGGTHSVDDFVQRDVMVAELVRTDFDLILAYIAADRSDLCNPVY